MRIADCGLRIADLKRRSQRAFTMVEIAFSLAIVAFALVAIMGVLPTGMNVQKDNKDDTIINHDGAFWLEALRSGSKGIDDLVNYVEEITISNDQGVVRRLTNSFGPDSEITSGAQIVSLLTTPKITNIANVYHANTVVARVRAINGAAVEKRDPKSEFVFRYNLYSEVGSAVFPKVKDGPDTWNKSLTELQDPNLGNFVGHLGQNLHELRLTLRWPVFQQGTKWGEGRNQRSFRGLVNGSYQTANFTDILGRTNTSVFLEPNIYEYVADPSAAP